MRTRVEWVSAAQIEAERRVKMTEAGYEVGFVHGVDWMFRQQKLQQTGCSKLRELLVQELNRIIEVTAPYTESRHEIVRLIEYGASLERVIVLMDALPPVA